MSSPEITSRRNPKVAACTKLRQGRHRRKQGRFLIDGWREMRLAVEAGIDVESVFVCPVQANRMDPSLGQWLQENLEPQMAPVSKEVWEKIRFGSRDDGIVAVAKTPQLTLSDFQWETGQWLAVLEGVEKPGNIGAIARSADAAGIAGIIVVDPATDLFNPNAIRASRGALFHVPLFQADASTAMQWLQTQQIPTYATIPGAGVPYHQVDFQAGGAFVLGSESQGLRSEWDVSGAQAIQLPMQGVGDSLNVSVTAGILFYESLRDRALADS